MGNASLKPNLPELSADRIQARRDALVREVRRTSAGVRSPGFRKRRTWLTVTGTGVAAAAVAVSAAVFSGAATPAYAVTSNPDGSVTVTARDTADPTNADRELSAAGVRAVLRVPKAAADCPSSDRGVKLPDFGATPRGADAVRLAGGDNVLVVWPDRIPAGQVLVVRVNARDGNQAPLLGWDFYAAAPRCVVAVPTGPALPLPRSGPSSSPATR